MGSGSHRRYSRMLVPGRFQPPHLGHLSIISQALSMAEEVVIVVGSAQESYTLANPLTAGERIEALTRMIRSRLAGDMARIVTIAPVPDIEMHKVWVQYLRMLLPSFDSVITGNELVAILFEDMGFNVERPKFYMKDKCNGTLIRRKVLEGGNWRECLSDEVVSYLEEIGFAERLKRLATAP